MNKRTIDNFFSKIVKKECWLWYGANDTSGYGRFYDGKKVTGAHQFSYRLYKGEIPDGMVIMHSCDNKLCVNPDHLKCGTQKENLQDMYRKGRNRKINTYTRGEEHFNAKLNKYQVEKIRFIYNETNCTKISLANKFNVSRYIISNILSYKTYA